MLKVDKIEQSLNLEKEKPYPLNQHEISVKVKAEQEIIGKTYPGYKPLEQVIKDSLSISKQLDPKARYEQLKKGVLARKELNTERKLPIKD